MPQLAPESLGCGVMCYMGYTRDVPAHMGHIHNVDADPQPSLIGLGG